MCALVWVALASVGARGDAQAQAPPPAALADSARRVIEVAVLDADPQAIGRVRAFVDRAATLYPDNAWLLHYRGYALYREATVRMGRAPDSDVSPLLEAAQQALEESLKRQPLAESHALLSAVIGLRIGSSPVRGMTLGPRSNRQMERAIARAPNNPRVWLLRGIGAYHTPAMFGGGIDDAERHVRRALSLFANDAPPPPAPVWGYDEAWLWLGRILERQGKLADARAAYQRALELQPQHTWVREVLLPGVERKLKGSG